MTSPSQHPVDTEGQISPSSVVDVASRCQSLKFTILSISDQYACGAQEDATRLDAELHELWFEVIAISKLVPANSPEQDRLATIVLFARELGAIYMIDDNSNSNKHKQLVTASNGARLWNDLPWLIDNLQTVWKEAMSSQFTAMERLNLAAFTARLLALGIGDANAIISTSDGGLGLCALLVFRETLEVERPLLRGEGGDTDTDKDTGSLSPTVSINQTNEAKIQTQTRSSSVSICDLLPACIAWLEYARFKILRLCAGHHSLANTTNLKLARAIVPGELAANSGIKHLGFSVGRWVCWRMRLKELSRHAIPGEMTTFKPSTKEDDLAEQSEMIVATLGRRGFDEMIHTGKTLGIDIPGEKTYWKKVWAALDAELTRSGKECVSLQDIEVDLDWAD